MSQIYTEILASAGNFPPIVTKIIIVFVAVAIFLPIFIGIICLLKGIIKAEKSNEEDQNEKKIESVDLCK